MRHLRKKLDKLREPRILGGFQSAFVDETESTKGWRFMGQRFVPDAYVLGRSVWDHIGPDLEDERIEPFLRACRAPGATCKEILEDTGLSSCVCAKAVEAHMPELCRLLPKGLDVMAVMGSQSAVRNLAPDWDYCGFPENYKDLRKEFGAYSRDDWRQNAYWYWLDALRPLLEDLPEGYPEWMRTPAWATKELNTALTSWAELRHDTILYVKQSYTSRTLTSFQAARFGSVEPVPEFYARLRDLATYTKDGLISHGALPEAVEPHFDELVWLLERLMEISIKELEEEELSRSDFGMIKSIGDEFDRIITGLAEAVQIVEETPDHLQIGCGRCRMEWIVAGDDPFKTTLIADVHTDVNTETVLEVGSGYLDWIIVAWQRTDGTIGASVGPVFSYYEFAHPMNDRLTVEAWNDLLDSSPPSRPAWIEDIRSP
jgi:hypothetical protein